MDEHRACKILYTLCDAIMCHGLLAWVISHADEPRMVTDAWNACVDVVAMRSLLYAMGIEEVYYGGDLKYNCDPRVTRAVCGYTCSGCRAIILARVPRLTLEDVVESVRKKERG